MIELKRKNANFESLDMVEKRWRHYFGVMYFGKTKFDYEERTDML